MHAIACIIFLNIDIQMILCYNMENHKKIGDKNVKGSIFRNYTKVFK